MSTQPTIATTFKPLMRNRGLPSEVVSRVIQAVLEGRLAEGDRLVAQKLANQLSVSATPVREALVSLADIGVVELLPNRGAVCRAFGPQQLREIYQVRRILEAEAARCACDALADDDLLMLREKMAALLDREERDEHWSGQAMRLDRDLHGLIYRHCGSERIRHELNRYETLMQGIRQHVANQQDVQRRALNEHLEIIDALLERNPALAGQRIADHIRNTGRDVERLMFPGPNEA